jgi:tetrahydromethanopterin:alpha-L-glutamate ligase
MTRGDVAGLHTYRAHGDFLPGRRTGGSGGRVAAVRFGVVTSFEHEDKSSRELLAACRALGDAEAVDAGDLSVRAGAGGVELGLAGRPASHFDVFLLVRLSERGDFDVQYEMLRVLEQLPALVLSPIDALLAAQDKLRTSRVLAMNEIRTPPIVVVQRPEDVATAMAVLGRTVLKPVCGSLGNGVELVEPDARGMQQARRRVMEERALYLQRFVDHRGTDLRVFVVGDQVAGAMARRAAPDDFRTNLAVGGEPFAIDLPPEAGRLAVAATRVLGLEWAGVDMVLAPEGPTVIEVNGSPSWERLLEVTGKDMAERIAQHAARRVLELRPHMKERMIERNAREEC